MTIPPAKWRSQMRLEIPPALWESHLRSEDRRCVLKSHLRYENRTCEVEIADAFWNPAAALWESHLRSDGRRCVLKTHLRPSLRRCDSHNNAAAERSGTLTSAGGFRRQREGVKNNYWWRPVIKSTAYQNCMIKDDNKDSVFCILYQSARLTTRKLGRGSVLATTNKQINCYILCPKYVGVET